MNGIYYIVYYLSFVTMRPSTILSSSLSNRRIAFESCDDDCCCCCCDCRGCDWETAANVLAVIWLSVSCMTSCCAETVSMAEPLRGDDWVGGGDALALVFLNVAPIALNDERIDAAADWWFIMRIELLGDETTDALFGDEPFKTSFKRLSLKIEKQSFLQYFRTYNISQNSHFSFTLMWLKNGLTCEWSNFRVKLYETYKIS